MEPPRRPPLTLLQRWRDDASSCRGAGLFLGGLLVVLAISEMVLGIFSTQGVGFPTSATSPPTRAAHVQDVAVVMVVLLSLTTGALGLGVIALSRALAALVEMNWFRFEGSDDSDPEM